jgi:hypothetical protein
LRLKRFDFSENLLTQRRDLRFGFRQQLHQATLNGVRCGTLVKPMAEPESGIARQQAAQL